MSVDHLPEVKQMLLTTLQNLGSEDFEMFKWHLQNNSSIIRSHLEGANRFKTVDLMVQHEPQKVVDMTIRFLRSINRNDLALNLSQVNIGESKR
ncbi:pyrin [Etheostoma spectabile]|uniref:pyrin n=1 Tax=Etheostoma spectabile TaxID=54343 RepID=UPI0013AFCEDA|nr:pyrin-like [Etheostoma spectabile]